MESNVKDETRAGERADDLNLGKMRSGVRPCELRSIPARCLCRLVRLFIHCLIEIQAKNVFFRLFVSALAKSLFFPMIFKTAFLQHSYRPDVVRCCPGGKSADLQQGGASY